MNSSQKQKGLFSRLHGKVTLITGVARLRGMGNCVAQRFADAGAHVMITDIVPQVKDREKDLRDQGYSARSFQVDLTILDDVKAMARQIIDQYGRIDILVNVAGRSIPPRPPFLEMTQEYWNIVMGRNLTTALNCCWAVLPYMVKQQYGKVINFSSITGPKTILRYSSAYAAAKGALSALTRALAVEMGEHHITVNAILPGDIDTEDEAWKTGDDRRDLGQFNQQLNAPIPRPGRSEEVADLALYLASDESSYITGTEIIIDGGATLVEPFLLKEFVKEV